MIQFDDVPKKHKRTKPKLAKNPDDLYKILIIEGPASGKTNLLFNLIAHQLDISNNYLYAKTSNEAIYQLLINKRKSTGVNYFTDPKGFIEYLNDIDDINILQSTIQMKNANCF